MGHVLRGGSGLRGRHRNGGTKGEEEIGGVRGRLTTTIVAAAAAA